MFTDNINLSLWLCGFFIFTIILSVFVIFRIVKIKSNETEQSDKLIDLLKWLIGTVGITVITFIINWGFKDREQGMSEILQYDKYATELIVLNDNPVKRRMLSQFFANVTPSEKLKNGWKEYYVITDKEYQKFMEDLKQKEKNLESLQSKDSVERNQRDKSIIQKLEKEIQEKKDQINKPLVIPNFSKSTDKNLQLASQYEDLGFNSLLSRDLNNAIVYFTLSENNYNSYHNVYDIAKLLKDNQEKIISQPEYWTDVYKKNN
ncbi:hypothetical protein [Chryseobacterium sp. Leaf394]|uniref:hypothetical protein n=1 Tax=Chryseobacterium sp. Leaf394 TaxID=1736361 RepID=UPI0006FDB5A8|nr:hypothetical protein [Chryseobacterium sp. Leaf394]KQS92217.1 hypothetical protein ASG21_07170 [Chryseobacterium sp. Leaf394]